MKKLIMILVMAMVAFGLFAKDFEYKADDTEWKYSQAQRTLLGESKGWYNEYTIFTYDVSEEEAWKIVNGKEFPTFTFFRYEEGPKVIIQRIPARDYRKGN